jgi:outer membrane scaffolding protein for murein synthesis (MipA/OmpV family)
MAQQRTRKTIWTRLLPVNKMHRAPFLIAAALFAGGASADPFDFVKGLEDLLAGKHKWEGAIGLNVGYGPAYLGSDDYSFGWKPALFLRYGRFSLSTGAGFTTRRADQVLRGLGVDVWSTERVRLSLAARLDSGRSESSSPALAGMGDVDGTLRVRGSALWRLDDGWQLGANASIDALGRGQGVLGDLSFSREKALTPDTVWVWGGSLSFGDTAYMRTYYGVTAAQAANTGYTQYTPSAGLRDVALSIGLRSELTPDWVGYVNGGLSQTLGPLPDSPLVVQPFGWGINAGLAWRF